jgi:hypothetical protein
VIKSEGGSDLERTTSGTQQLGMHSQHHLGTQGQPGLRHSGGGQQHSRGYEELPQAMSSREQMQAQLEHCRQMQGPQQYWQQPQPGHHHQPAGQRVGEGSGLLPG